MERTLIFLAGVQGFLAVTAGAFGAHALRGRLAPNLLEVFETGARYQIVHALALLATAWVAGRVPGRLPHLAGWFFFWGTTLFAGSLYLLALTGQGAFGAVTPLGGLGLLGGWGLLAAAGLKR